MSKRNKMIYDDGMTMLEEVAVDMPETNIPKRISTNLLSVSDVLDTMTGYTTPRFGLMDNTDGEGQCLMCGTKTSSKMRKLCVNCLETHGKEVYQKAKEAIERGDNTIVL